MPTWSQITGLNGVYISETFNISSELNRYITTIDITKINIHNQTLEFSYSVSYDNSNWSEWKEFEGGSSTMLDAYDLTNIYFRYRVFIKSDTSERKPYLQSISFLFQPYENIINVGDLLAKPKLWIRKIDSDGDVQLINHMTNQELILKNLRKGEEIFIDCEDEEIISSLQYLGIYRFDDHNDEYLELIRGDNYLRGYGDFDMDIRLQSPLLQE